MQRQSREHFDTSTIPDDLAPIATLCWLYCPVQCVVAKPRWFAFDLKVCKGCGVCAQECPQRAISMIEEAGR
jgi:Pyruvate/2-oxoacid:ferredoxin oxidoreductase delta subunit